MIDVTETSMINCDILNDLEPFVKNDYCALEVVGPNCPRTCGYCPDVCFDKFIDETGIDCSTLDYYSTDCDWMAGNRYACPETCKACLRQEEDPLRV